MEVVGAVLTVYEVLGEISNLLDTIRRQRAVNKKTYVRLMAIDHVLSDATRTIQKDERAEVIQQFEGAATRFREYLTKYGAMSRVVRILKSSKMEAERLKIEGEIDELCQVLNMATAMAVMKVEDTLTNVVTKLESIHGDIRRLSRGQLQKELMKTRVVGMKPDQTKFCGGMASKTNEHVVDECKLLDENVGSNAMQENPLTKLKQTSVSQVADTRAMMVTEPIQLTNLPKEESNVEPKVDNDPVVELPLMSNRVDDVEGDKRLDYPTPLRKLSDCNAIPEGEVETRKDEVLQRQLTFENTFSIPQLLQLLDSDQTTTEHKEEVMLLLMCRCTTNDSRTEVCKRGGIPVLERLIRERDGFLTQIYALHCLSWFTCTAVLESEFVSLQECIREVTHGEIESLLYELQHGDKKVKQAAVISCMCMVTRGDGDILCSVGAVSPLVDLLLHGTTNQKLWAAEALATLTSGSTVSCAKIAHEGAIPPLVALLRSGNDKQHEAAIHALGNLAAHNEENRDTIGCEGAIPLMVASMRITTNVQNPWAEHALAMVSLNHEVNSIAIADEGAIAPLVALLREGTPAQKVWATQTLGNLASTNDVIRDTIKLEGAVTVLLQLLQVGTPEQKQRAMYALGVLVCNDEMKDQKGIAVPLIELVKTGSATEKQDAARVLGMFAASDDDQRDEIGSKGAIVPLVKLLQGGLDAQKETAAYALRCLAINNDANRFAILEEGALIQLQKLVETGTEGQKTEAARALQQLDAINKALLPERIITPLMGYLLAGVTSQSTTVAAALSTLKTVPGGVIPLFQKFVKLDGDIKDQPESLEIENSAPKVATIVSNFAEAW